MSFYAPYLSFFSNFGYCTNFLKNSISTAPIDGDRSLENPVKHEHSEFLKKYNIRSDLVIQEKITPGFANTLGGNNTFATPIISLSPGIREIDKEAFNSIFKYEIAHVYYNDVVIQHLTGLSAGCIHTLATYFLLNPVYQSVDEKADGGVSADLVFLGSCIYSAKKITQYATCKFNRFCVERADQFALDNMTIEEKLGRRRQFKAWQNFVKEVRSPDSEVLLPNGDVVDPKYPTSTERIKIIEESLSKDGFDLSTLQKLDQQPDQQEKIKQLVEVAHKDHGTKKQNS